AMVVEQNAPLSRETLAQQEVPATLRQEPTQAELAIGGMTCASCVARIERKLGRVPGVSEASVNLATEKATVRYDPEATDVPALVGAVEAAGYTARPLVAAPPVALAPAGAAQAELAIGG